MTIFPQIAYDLATGTNPASSKFLISLLAALKAKPKTNVARMSLDNQLETFIVDPVKASGMATVVIIDALDECKDDETTSTVLAFLDQHAKRIPTIKFFITSRPETHIRLGFRRKYMSSVTDTMILHEVSPTSVDGDIMLFLEEKLNGPHDRSDVELPQPWPTVTQLNDLVKKCQGLFIYASTAVKFVMGKDSDPPERLEALLRRSDDYTLEGTAGLDRLYSDILESAYTEETDEFMDMRRTILGLMVVLSDPLSASAMAEILTIENSAKIKTCLRSLHSLLIIPQDAQRPLRFHHKSFPDFLTDPTRCKDTRFQIDRNEYHTRTARNCFELMGRAFKKNICRLERFASNSSLSPEERARRISEALIYCCRYWADHALSDSCRDRSLEDILSLLDGWLKTEQLRWFEVLSLAGELGRAVKVLSRVVDWLGNVSMLSSCPYLYLLNARQFESQPQTMLALVIDSHRFILSVFDIAQESAMHIYHCLLAFAPEQSVLKRCYADSDDMKDEPRVALGCDKSWIGPTRIIHVPNQAYSVKYSPKGSVLAVGGYRYSLAFDSGTGEQISALDSDCGLIRSVAWSCDNRALATLDCNGMIHLWDIGTGSRIGELHGSSEHIDFHPDISDLLVASGYGDEIVVWNMVTSAKTSFRVDRASGSLCWSTEKRVLIGRASGTVEMWDVGTDPPQQVRVFSSPSSQDWIRAVASSRDGSLVASGSSDGTPVVYDANTGNVVRSFNYGSAGTIYSLAFSPTEPILAFGSESHIVGLVFYDEAERIVSLTGHTNHVNSVAFSPDGRFIASASDDLTIQIRKTNATNHSADDGHYGKKKTLARVSPDGRYIVSVSEDGTIEVWDSCTDVLSATLGLDRYSLLLQDAIILSDNLNVVFTDYYQVLIWNWRVDKLFRVHEATRQNHGHIASLSPCMNYARTIGLEFISFHLNYRYRILGRTVCGWTIRTTDTGDACIALVAHGYFTDPDSDILRVTHRESTETTDSELVVESTSGRQFSAPWHSAITSANTPRELHFQVVRTSGKSRYKYQSSPLTILRLPCRQSESTLR